MGPNPDRNVGILNRQQRSTAPVVRIPDGFAETQKKSTAATYFWEWGPVRFGARSGLEPIWALMGPLAGPGMSDFRLLVEFCMFWVHNWVFDKISR